MIVQATNTGSDVGNTQFDLAVSSCRRANSMDEMMLMRCLDARRRLRHVRRLLQRVGRHSRCLGRPVWVVLRPILALLSLKRYSRAAVSVGGG